MDELWGCFKHVGMSWDMVMKLPIQDRRTLIHKHNIEQEEINREYDEINGDGSSTSRYYEGESINTFAQMEQNNMRRGGM
jgi:hypothetical protein